MIILWFKKKISVPSHPGQSFVSFRKIARMTEMHQRLFSTYCVPGISLPTCSGPPRLILTAAILGRDHSLPISQMRKAAQKDLGARPLGQLTPAWLQTVVEEGPVWSWPITAPASLPLGVSRANAGCSCFKGSLF